MRIGPIYLAVSLGLSGGILGAQTGDSLRMAISAKEDSLHRIEQSYQRLKQRSDQLNGTIFNQKKASRSSYDPLLWLKLYSNLRSASSLAAELEITQVAQRKLQRELKHDYRQMIIISDGLIAGKIQEFHRQPDQAPDRTALKALNQLEIEKNEWRNKIVKLTPPETTLPQLTLEPGDGVERIRLKMKLAQDYLQKVRTELTALQDQREKLQVDLRMYREMVNFTENLQQVSDPEQEYFDQERIDHLRDEVRTTKLKIAEIQERIEQVKDKETHLMETYRNFDIQLENKMKN